MPFFFHRFLGYYRIFADEKDITRLYDLLFREHIVTFYQKKNEILIPRSEKIHLEEAAKRARIPLVFSKLMGAPRLVRQYRYRVGVLLGIFLFFFMLYFGTNTVWRVEVSGVDAVRGEEITENLKNLGFGVGSSKKTVSYEPLIAAYRLAYPETAWMGIYTTGTTAKVKVILKEDPSDSLVKDPFPCNLIATSDAIVVRTDIAHGTLCVKRGDVVKKGDLLVLGLSKGAHNDILLNAEGEVVGRVNESFSVSVPKKQRIKTEEGREKLEINCFFFENIINIFKNTSQTNLNYAIIEKNEKLYLNNDIPLPFGYQIKEAVFYREEEKILTETEAIRLAQAILAHQIEEKVGEGALLSRRVWMEKTSEEYVLHADIAYTKNIAEKVPFIAE